MSDEIEKALYKYLKDHPDLSGRSQEAIFTAGAQYGHSLAMKERIDSFYKNGTKFYSEEVVKELEEKLKAAVNLIEFISLNYEDGGEWSSDALVRKGLARVR
jgi:hypothetical protein